MKFFNNKIILLLITIPVILLVMLLGYQTISEYSSYRKNKNNLNALHVANMLNIAIDKVGAEAISVATNGKYGNMQKTRFDLDKSLSGLSNEDIIEDEMDIIKENIESVRSLVDKKKAINYVDVFKKRYGDQILLTLYGLVGKVVDEIKPQDIQTTTILSNLSKLKSTSYTENALLAYAINNRIKLSSDALKGWDALLNNSKLPSLEITHNQDLSNRIKQIIDTSRYSIVGQIERSNAIAGAITGKYHIDLVTWIGTNKDKAEKLTKAYSLLIENLQEKEQKALSGKKQRTIKYLVQTIVALVILVFLLSLLQNIYREKRTLSKTLKNIQLDLSEEKKQELEKLIEEKDTKQIYSFLAEVIKESNYTRDQFLSNISHEIRTPLNGIVGFTQLLKKTKLQPNQEEFLKITEDSSATLLNIVNDILDLSKIQAEDIEIKSSSFKIFETIESVADSFAQKVMQKDIDYGLYIDPSLPQSLIGDSKRLSQILNNLISNAVKFTGTYGEINVTCKPEELFSNKAVIKFSVSDTGIGIDPKQQKMILKAFEQADSSSTRNFGGAGVGLTIANKLITLMDGKLEIESQLGEGATFSFSLPFKIDRKNSTTHKHGFGRIEAGLLLPHESINRGVDRILKSYLGSFGISLMVYNNDTIYQMDPKALPDILFVDQRYARRGGEISKIVKLPTKIILIAADNQKQIQSIKDDVEHIIYKPINYTKLTKALKSIQGDINIESENNGQEDEVVFEGVNVLVAEDNRINQKLIRTALENFGVRITIASNGKEAVMLRKQKQYDIIFMDIQMPVMDGAQATQEILQYEKKHKQNHVPIIALTANALRGDKEKYISSGMDDYIPKPMSLDLIQKMVQKYCPDKFTINKNTTDSAAEQTEQSLSNTASEKEPIYKTNMESTAKKLDSANILIYSKHSLSSKIQKQILEKNGFGCKIVDTGIAFLNEIQDNRYSAVLAQDGLLDLNNCQTIDTLKNKNIKVFIHTAGTKIECKSAKSYTLVEDILDKLRS